MLSVHSDSFTYSFPVWMAFISFSCLIALARTSVMLCRSGKSGHPCLVLYFRGITFDFFTIEYDVRCRFVIYDLYYVEARPFLHILLRILNKC